MQDTMDIELMTMKDQNEDSTLIIPAANEFEDKSVQTTEVRSVKTEEPLLLIPEDLPPPPPPPPSTLPARCAAPQFPIKRSRSASFQLRRGIQEVRNIISRKVC